MRQWECMLDPETDELTYGHNHGCTDGFIDITVVEKSKYDKVLEAGEIWKHEAKKLRIENDELLKANKELKEANDCLARTLKEERLYET